MGFTSNLAIPLNPEVGDFCCESRELRIYFAGNFRPALSASLLNGITNIACGLANFFKRLMLSCQIIGERCGAAGKRDGSEEREGQIAKASHAGSPPLRAWQRSAG